MKCTKCQFENPDNAKFCIECGAPIEFHCPQCGAMTPVTGKFCMDCGHRLSRPAEKPSADFSFDEKIKKIQKYLPKGITEKILSQRDRIEGERKHVTVMFCDMQGYSRLTEKLGPEKAYEIIDMVYEILIQKVHDFDGTVNEMTGDGVMALFGAPIALEDAPQRAIRSAMAIHREMARYSQMMREQGKDIPTLKMRAGIHTGPVVVGSLGNDLRLEFKAVGETVNLASRMEGLAESGTTFVTENTFRLTEGFFRFEALGEKDVKGKEKPISVYRVIAPSARRTRFDVSAEQGLTAFVGRERELELMLDGFERAKSGRGQAFSIMGEAGVGKSRLLYEFRKAVANEDVTFLEGKCLSYSQGVAYHPVIDILKSNFDIREEDKDYEIREKVSRSLRVLNADETSTLPYLLELLSITDSGIDKISMSAEVRKDCIIQAVRRIALKGSETRLLIMAFEDLHWIDKSSEDSLRDLLENISGARVFLIFTYRPEFVHTWGGKSYHNQVTLNRFSNRESLSMVTHLLSTENIDKGLKELVLEKTEGIPFFIEEFIKTLLEQKVIEKQRDIYRLVKDAAGMTVPSTVQDVLMARIDSLADGVKDVLQTGSVVGREFNQELIQVVTGLSERELLSHLSVLKDSELLYERGIYPQSNYIFIHALTQEVAYNSLLSKRRKEIHRAIGKAIESLQDQRLDEFYEILAYHYSKSDGLEKAYQYLKLSGNKTTRNYSNWEAFHFYNDAINILNQLPDSRDNKGKQIEVILLMSGPMMFLSYPEDSLRILEEGVRLCKELNDKKSLATIYSLLGIYYMHRGKPLESIKYSEFGYEEPSKRQDIDLMAPIARGLCVSYIGAGQAQLASNFAPNVIDLLEKSHRESDMFGAPFNTYSLLCAYYALGLAMLGNFEKAMEYFEKGLRSALSINHLASLGVLEAQFGLMFILKGDGTNAIKHFQNSIRYFEESKTVLIFAVTWSGLGSGYYLLGELEAARKHINKGIDLTNRGGSEWWQSFHYLFLSKIHFELGDQKSSRSAIEEALKISQKNNEEHFEGASRTFLGRILGKTDPSQSDTAAKHILKGIKILDELKIKPWCAEGYLYLGELYASTGNKNNALNNLRKAEAIFQKFRMDHYLSKTQEILSRL